MRAVESKKYAMIVCVYMALKDEYKKRRRKNEPAKIRHRSGDVNVYKG